VGRLVGVSASPLSGSPALLDSYDALLLDLDGVVYLDDEPVDGAVAALQQARDAGLAITFVTNNAAHTPADVVDRLTSIGVRSDIEEVVTSSMAAGDLLARDLPAAAPVLVVGGRGLWAAVEAAGLTPTRTADGARAVVQGWGPDVAWADLAEATVALRAGARWIATNLDRTLPSPRGPLPGSGSLIAAVSTATGREPDAVAGKPYPPLLDAARRRSGGSKPLLDAARRRSGGSKPLVVGDRLDTDIAGAVAAGLPALLVLTGVSQAADLLAAPAEQRPTYLGRDLAALNRGQPAVAVDGTVRHQPGSTDDGLDQLRSEAVRAWNSPDLD
jgi:HAD superfamily hydrolase (TIGR01450 family)